MPSFELNYEEAHAFVEKNIKNNFFWDGYTLVKWNQNPDGYMATNGLFRKGKWGYATYYKMTNRGTWKVSDKYARFI